MFDNARLKVERANSHIIDFCKCVDDFVKTDFMSFEIEDRTLKFKITRDLPSHLPLILGDAVHNLRVALDLAYVELITLLDKTPTKWTTFRMWESRQKLVSTLGEGILNGEPDVVEMLADVVGAYQGGNEILYALDSLDISDKHVLLIPVISIIRLDHTKGKVTSDGNTVVTLDDVSLSVDLEGQIDMNLIHFGDSGADLHFEGKGEPAFGVFFGKDTNIQGQPIPETLLYFRGVVENTIKNFEKTVLSRNSI